MLSKLSLSKLVANVSLLLSEQSVRCVLLLLVLELLLAKLIGSGHLLPAQLSLLFGLLLALPKDVEVPKVLRRLLYCPRYIRSSVLTCE